MCDTFSEADSAAARSTYLVAQCSVVESVPEGVLLALGWLITELQHRCATWTASISTDFPNEQQHSAGFPLSSVVTGIIIPAARIVVLLNLVADLAATLILIRALV